MTFTSHDLALVRNLTRKYARQYGMMNHHDDFISDTCMKLAKMELPDDQNYRERLICRVCYTSSIDHIRRVGVTPRRVIGKIKRGELLSVRDKTKCGRLLVVDFNDYRKDDNNRTDKTFFEHICLTEEKQLRVDNVRQLLSELDNPVMRKSIELYYFEDMKLLAIGKRLDLSEARISQLVREGLAILRKKIEVYEAKFNRHGFEVAV